MHIDDVATTIEINGNHLARCVRRKSASCNSSRTGSNKVGSRRHTKVDSRMTHLKAVRLAGYLPQAEATLFCIYRVSVAQGARVSVAQGARVSADGFCRAERFLCCSNCPGRGSVDAVTA